MSRILWIIALGAAFALASDASAQLDRRTPIVEAINKARPSIVNIRTLRNIPARFEEGEAGGGGRIRGLGTGVIIDPRGYVITNHHVIEQVDEIKVLLSSDETPLQAQVVKSDERNDLALLKINAARTFDSLSLWGPQPLVGETVIAIGNPYGLENSVSIGIVSAINRDLKLPNGEQFEDLMQTDAGINPGNSGGPLLDVNGDLLGITVAIRANAQNIGFAIPARKVREVVERLMVRRYESFLSQGLHVREVEPEGEKDRFIGKEPILKVSSVEPNSVADKLGFRPDDEIVRVAGERVRMRFDLDRILWGREDGAPIEIEVSRNGGSLKKLALAVAPMSTDDLVWQMFGIRGSGVGREAVRVKPEYEKINGGLRLTSIAPDSVAARAGFRVGDILIGLNSFETVKVADVRWLMESKDTPKNKPISYHLIRDNSIQEGTLQMPTFP